MAAKSLVRQLVAIFLIETLFAQPLAILRFPLVAVAEAAPAPRLAALTEPAGPGPDSPPDRTASESAPAPYTYTSAADASALDVFVGFADNSTPSANFPTPWQGAPNVVFLGAGAPVDAGAIRLDNTSSVPVTIDRVDVDLQRANAQFALWQNFTIPAGGSAILTQTQPGNFETSAYPIVPCGGTIPTGDPRVPKITVTVGGAQTSFLDTAHVLDTGGFDLSCRGNESLQWRHLATAGIDSPSGHLTLAPSALSGTGGSSVTLTAQLTDANRAPLANATVDFKATSGPNAGQSGQGVTDAQGNVRFAYTGTAQGADVVRASITNASTATVFSDESTVTWTTASCGPDVPLPPTGQASLLYIGATRGQFSDPIELAALLSDASASPVAGRMITFSFAGQTLAATTDATGVARVATVVNAAPAEVPVTADFAGDSTLPQLRANATVTVEREDVVLSYTGKRLIGTAVPQPVSATLLDPDSLAPIPNKTVTFTVGDVTATAVTNASGVASTTLTLGPAQVSGPSSLTVSFAGDVYYKPAVRTVAITIYLSTSFVVWGGNTGGLKLGQRVNFWGAQWENQVIQGDYPWLSAFKGLADPVDQIHICQPNATTKSLTPGCWISKGGQTWPPPVSVPAYIEVIVSTAIAKNGSDFFGNIAAAVVVKVDPQPAYAPDPGKPGWGVIVAVIEDSTIFPQPASVTATQTQPRTVLPNEQFTVATTITNTSTATSATNVALTETLDGVTPPNFAQSVGTLPAGASQTVSFRATTPTIPIRQGSESTSDYIQRLATLNGRVFTSAGQVTFSDAQQQLYLPVDVSSQSVLAIPILTLSLSGPAVVSPGAPAPYRVTVTNIGSATANGAVTVTMADGSVRTIDVANVVAGSSFTQIAAFTPEAIAPKSPTETTAQYLARLAAIDGQLLTTTASLTWRDANGNNYGDIGRQIFTSRLRIPILRVSTQAPATLAPGETATLKFAVQNTGGCTAVLSNLNVTNPDGTSTAVPQFVLGSGEQTTIETTWRVPEVAKKGDDETDAQYLARLTAINNSNLDFNISLDWQDPSGAVYGPTTDTAHSKEVLPIVPVTLSAPASADAGNTITYAIGLSNVGAATATQMDVTLTLPNGNTQKVAAPPIPAGGTYQATVDYAIPSTQAAGKIQAVVLSVWTDAMHNAFGSLSATATTDVTNPTSFNSLVLTPAIAGPNVTGTAQIMTATLRDPASVPIANATVVFVVTGANTATGSAITNPSGVATFTYTGSTSGVDNVQATSGSAVSNIATVNWIVPVKAISTSPLLARYFASDGSGVFNTPPTATPAFMQAFPTINFNPPAGTIPGNTSGVGVFTRPFTNVTTDLNGNFTGTIVAEGNGLQAGVGTLFTFQAVYTGSLTVAGAGDMVINFYSDDGFIFGVGNGATRVSGPLLNVPAGNITPFEHLPVMGAYNAATAPVANTIVVHFPAAGQYPYEVDYSECCAGQLALTVAAGNVGMPPTGSLKLTPIAPASKPTGSTQTLTVEAFDGAGQPVANASVGLVVEGANNTQVAATTDALGRATFTYTGVYAGTDKAQAIGRVAGLITFSNVVNVPWGVGATPPPDPNMPGGVLGVVVTQGWIGSPIIGSTIQTRTSITVASGVSLTSGILDYWPTDNPAEVKVLNPNTVGGGTIGTIDPTVLANGEYMIRLRATLSNGTQQTSLIVVEVTGDNKPGRVTKTVTDMRIPVAGMPLTITRHYDSLERGKVGDFGYGWSLSANVRLDVNKKNDVTFNFNGRRQTFTFKPQNGPFPFTFFFFPKWVPEPGTYGTLTADSCGLLILTEGSFTCFLDVPGSFNPTAYHYTDNYGRQFDMTAEGKLTAVKDLNNNTITISPNGIFSTSGNVSVPFTRDVQGRITQITDPAGHHYDYGYDAFGNLTNVHLPAIDTPVQYEYSTDHLLTKEIDPRGAPASATYYPDGRLKSETDRMNFTTQYAYDTTANTLTTTYPDGGVTVRTMNAGGKVISYRDQLNRVSTFTYDANQNLLTKTNALGKTWTYTYDANGNLTSSKDPLGNITRKTWDSRGRMLNMTDPLNQVTQFQYDATGNVTGLSDSIGPALSVNYDSRGDATSLTLPGGRQAQFTYDAFGNRTGVVDHSGFASTREFDSLGHMTSIKDARHGEITMAYDTFGNFTQWRDPLGNTLKYTYDANGNRATGTDPNGGLYTYDYNANDQLIRITYPDGTKEENTYDYAGRVLTSKNRAGVVTQYVWDKAGQLTSATEAVGTSESAPVSFTYDPAGRMNSFTDGRNNTTVVTYDDADRVKSMRDAAGGTTTYTYDADGRMTAATRPDNLTRQSKYDARGRVTERINPDGTSVKSTFDAMNLQSVTGEDGRTTSYTYDQHGEIASVADPAGHLIQYVRDAVGNLTTVRDPNGHETRYEYDIADRLVKKILPDGTFEQYTRDAQGHVTAVRLTDGNTNRFTWDAAGHLSRIDYFDGKTTTYTYTPTGKRFTATALGGTTQYSYDSRDRLVSITQPTGVVIRYTYDAEENVTSITTPRGVTRYTYDVLQRLKTVTDPTGGVTNYTYDTGGRLVQRTLANGVVTDYTYDSLDRLKSVVHHLGVTAAFASFQYTFSANGQRVNAREVDGTQTNWTYDDAYRLVRENVVNPAGTTIADLAYAYDAAGNRTSMTANGVTTIYQYNAVDEMTSAGSTQYNYDARGNLIRATDASGMTSYSYDAANHLTNATMPNGTVMTYSYDADGRLTRQQAGATVRNFAWDERSEFGDIVYESDGAGGSIANYSYGGNELVQRLGATPSYYVQDGLGSVVGLTNTAGALTDSYRYDAFGVRTSTSGTTTNPFGYRGQWSDPSTSLQYLRARWLSNGTGRFLSRDDVAFRLENPIDLNRYTYVNSNPIDMYDPTGQSAAAEYGMISNESAENSTIEGYLVGRKTESLWALFLCIFSASMVDALVRAADGTLNPVGRGGKVWARKMKHVTVAFGWVVWGPTDVPGPDSMFSPSTEIGRKTLLWKAGVFRSSRRELAWAMSGFSVVGFIKYFAEILTGTNGTFLGNDFNDEEACNNHAELKVLRYASPPTKSVLEAVGASRPVCANCQRGLAVVIEYGGFIGPLGGNLGECATIPEP